MHVVGGICFVFYLSCMFLTFVYVLLHVVCFFVEFKEMVCAMSSMFHPDPWIAQEKKLKLFVDELFVAASDIFGH